MTGPGYQAGQAVSGSVAIIQQLVANLQQGEEITYNGKTITRTAQGAQVKTAKK
jgi:hypothetical protein